MQRMTRFSGRTFSLLLAVLFAVVCAGCAPLPWQPSASITGVITGPSMTEQSAGTLSVVGIPAHVACEGNSTTASSDGHFSLTVVQAKSYSCNVSASGYRTVTLSVPGGSAATVMLDLTDSAAKSCASSGRQTTCPILAFAPGSLTGVVTDKDTKKPVANATVECLSVQAPSGAAPATTKSNSSGAYTLSSLAAGTYGCFTGSRLVQYTQVVVQPGQHVRHDFASCSSVDCPQFTYHGGPVMHSQNIYVIFWQPPGTHFDGLNGDITGSNAGDAAYEQDIEQYFRDIGGSSLYGMLHQYPDFSGPPLNEVHLAGITIAHDTLPGPATETTPLVDTDMQTEVERVITQQHWPIGPTSLFFLYLPMGAHACSGQICTFKTFAPGHFGYHSDDISFSRQAVPYAVVGDPHTNTNGGVVPSMYTYGVLPVPNAPSRTLADAPHGSWAIDLAISISSHEEFEAATDPVLQMNAWGDDQGQEIGDPCKTMLPPPDAQGYDVQLHGHGYYIQPEWSNSARKCAFS